MYDRLRSPFKLGKLELPNRLAMTAMGVNLGAPDGGVTDDLIAYYEARARGGVGLIITEITRITGGAGMGEPCQLSSYRAGDIPDLQRLVDVVHRWDTKLFVQLQHPGREASSWATGEQPVAPSAVANPMGGETPRELSLQECSDLAQRFVNAAHIAQMAGVDGVELHAAHGYLINSFLSPAMNFRTDDYGGSFENRMRFVREILAGIRKECGLHFPVSVRINAEEALPGGIDLEEAARIAVALEEAGASMINVSTYSDACIEPGTYAQGWKSHLPEAVKPVVSIPVLSVCNIKEPAAAEALLEQGACDVVGVARALLADPDWPRKAFSGREDEIRTCIGCLCCFAEICKMKRIRCAVNPLTGREREYAHPTVNGSGRRVAIVGGGPAGIQAALTLKQRGFAPVLFDEEKRPGGTLNTADKGYGKEKITSLVQALHTQMLKAGVELRLGERATAESLETLNPVAVFVACGAEPLRPPVPGIEGDHVITADSVLLGENTPRGSVAVIGAGMTGLETAEMLAMDGCKVILVEMLETLGCDVYPSVVRDVMSRMLPHDPLLLTGHKLTSVQDKSIELQRLSDGESISLDVDWVVLAVGVKPRGKMLANACRQEFGKVRVIGDAYRPGRVLEAMQDAQGTAFVFEPDQN